MATRITCTARPATASLLVWTSKNLVDWQAKGFAYHRSPQTWARPAHFWAPGLFKHNGKFYLHFTAQGGEKFLRRIVLTEGDSPLGPFHESQSAVVRHPGKV